MPLTRAKKTEKISQLASELEHSTSAIKEIKAGKVEFRTDKTALVHVPVGKLSFDAQKLVDNAMTVITSVVKAKPSAAKGKYIKGVTLSSTMGPGIQLDFAAAEAAGKS